MDLNRATIIGNVTRQPELRTTTTGQSVCSFGIATNMQWTDAQGAKQQRAEFHNLVAWGKLAEICNQYITKGAKVYAEGRLQTREWEAPDGQKRNRTEIVLDNMILLDRKRSDGAQPQPAAAATPGAPSAPAEPAPQPDQTQELRMEDIPF